MLSAYLPSDHLFTSFTVIASSFSSIEGIKRCLEALVNCKRQMHTLFKCHTELSENSSFDIINHPISCQIKWVSSKWPFRPVLMFGNPAGQCLKC